MTWSSVDLASQCLADSLRTRDLIRAVEAVVSEGDRVVDVGTGTGVLAVAAARCTNEQVFAVEIDADTGDFLARNANRLPSNVRLVKGDAKKHLGVHCEVVIVELIDIWLLCEELAPVLRSLYANRVISDVSKIIPLRYTFHLDLGWCDFSWHPGKVLFPYYEWPFYKSSGWTLPRFQPRIEFKCVENIALADIASGKSTVIQKKLQTPASSNSCSIDVNALRLTGTIHLTSSLEITSTNALNAPVVVPLKQSIPIGADTKIDVYAEFGEGLRGIRVTTDKATLL